MRLLRGYVKLYQITSGLETKNNPGIARDKAEWAQTIIEQAVGRLCRTRNKPQTTYILYDKDINCFF